MTEASLEEDQCKATELIGGGFWRDGAAWLKRNWLGALSAVGAVWWCGKTVPLPAGEPRVARGDGQNK